MSVLIAPMGNVNSDVGICGFASALMAIHDADGLANDLQGAAFQTATLPKRLCKEIQQFLQGLVGAGETNLIQSIEAFTRSFGDDYATFSVAQYLNFDFDSISMDNWRAVRSRFDVALPPQVLLRYLQNRWGLPAARMIGVGEDTDKYIVGVREKSKQREEYNGLVHWMYVSNGRVFSWGDQFDSITEADADFEEVYRIAIGVH
ncbi:MAG: hypothetical protein AAF511_04320 [Pseudomonadota bacterium]